MFVMLEIKINQMFQAGDIFRWRNPFYYDDKYNVPEHIHFIAGDRPAIITKVTPIKVYFFPLRSKQFPYGQIHLDCAVDYDCQIKNGINCISAEKHVVSHKEFEDLIDYYIASVNRDVVDLINEKMGILLQNSEENSKCIKAKIYSLMPGKIVKLGSMMYLVVSINTSTSFNVFPLIPTSKVYAISEGCEMVLTDDNHTYRIDFSKYKTINTINDLIEMKGYINPLFIPAVFNEYAKFMNNRLEAMSGLEKYILKLKNINSDITSLIRFMEENDIKEEKEEVVLIDDQQPEVQEIEEEPVVEIIENTSNEVVEVNDDVKEEEVINPNPMASQLSKLEQFRNALVIKEAMEKAEPKKSHEEEEYEELDNTPISNYFHPIMRSRYLKQTTGREILKHIQMNFTQFMTEYGDTMTLPRFNYMKKLVKESIDKRNAPFIIKRFM